MRDPGNEVVVSIPDIVAVIRVFVNEKCALVNMELAGKGSCLG